VVMAQGTVTFNMKEIVTIEELANGDVSKKVYNGANAPRHVGVLVPNTGGTPGITTITGTTGPAAAAQAPKPPQVEVVREMPKSLEELDNDGHNKAYWQTKVAEWKKKITDAKARRTKAEAAWNKYNSTIEAFDSAKKDQNQSISSYTLNEYTDFRGSARVDMDKADEDIAEAKRMLDEVIPEQARRAGAPPGWVRY